MRLATVSLLLLSGCYSPKIGTGDFKCAPPANLCPSGFVCLEGACYSAASPPTFDLSMGPFAGDGSGGALDLTSMSGALTFNTDTGEVRFTPDSGGTGTSMVPAGGGGYKKINQPSGGPAVGMWQFTSVTIPATVTVRPFGTSQSIFALAVKDTMTLAGSIDWRGFGGPAGLANAAGSGRASGVMSGGGGATDTTGSGGGGAGHAAMGGAGMGAAPGSGGMSYGAPDLVPVHVGSGGGGGGSGGGLGGGAVVLLATKLIITGSIDVSGNAGKNADSTATTPAGGGGGGSAGSILISGGDVLFDTGHSLIATGGAAGTGAAGGSNGGAGSDGRIWVGAQTLNITGGTLMAMPTEVRASTPVSTFPR